MYWPQLTSEQIKNRIFNALKTNVNYRQENILGIPATFLDEQVFYEDAPFLADAPFLSLLVANPNHIGCHTLPGDKEPIFRGTQQLETEVIRICAEEIFLAQPETYDGYVASGGTEGNIEAMWIYRNYFTEEFKASAAEIAVVYSADSHYSFAKGKNLLGIQSLVFDVEPATRRADIADLSRKLKAERSKGLKYFIVNINLATTMFGSVDDIDAISAVFEQAGVKFRIHIDAAFGGFIYPFTCAYSSYDFTNPHVSSISIDAHKMLQTPYGTGIFLVRKNMMQYVCTTEASYVMGKDFTLIGSRSGANAACIWMVLHTYGSEGWRAKLQFILSRTDALSAALDHLKITYFRNPNMNIITIKSEFISPNLARAFCLVPDNHEQAAWYKIVVMSHVKQGVLDKFIEEVRKERQHGQEAGSGNP
jgi:tyrosine decarboxylase / aspartate 1-decarboxylase